MRRDESSVTQKEEETRKQKIRRRTQTMMVLSRLSCDVITHTVYPSLLTSFFESGFSLFLEMNSGSFFPLNDKPTNHKQTDMQRPVLQFIKRQSL
jgi:hypothetical protein